jgi:hypothetical protein
MYNSHYSGTLEIPLKGSDNVLEISRSNLPNPAELFEILRSEEAPLRHYVLFAVSLIFVLSLPNTSSITVGLAWLLGIER